MAYRAVGLWNCGAGGLRDYTAMAMGLWRFGAVDYRAAGPVVKCLLAIVPGHPSNTLAYLWHGSAQTSVCAASLR